MIKIAASSLVLGTMLFVGAAQAQPAKLTTKQMDQVTAGFLGNFNGTLQGAFSSAKSCVAAGCGNESFLGNYSEAVSGAGNLNATGQNNVILSFGGNQPQPPM
jgi:hypothetical protein